MNPSPNRQAVVVGLFVASSAAILAGGVLTIGDLNDTFTHKITISALFDEVNGLQQGDNIWFSGVKVGIVKAVGFHGASQVEVQMKVDTSATQYIHRDVSAKIGSDGLIGSKLVILYGGTPDAPILVNGDVLASGKTISTEEIMATLQANNTNLLAITTDLKGISGQLARGEGTVGKLLQDESLYTGIADTVTTLGAASENAKGLTASLSSFGVKLNQAGGLPNDLVTDRTTYAALTTTVDGLRHTGERASDLVDGLARGASDPGSPIGTLMHDEQAGNDLKGTLDNLNQGSLLLAEDLEAAKHNFLLRGFFRKQERTRAKALAEAETDTREASPAAE